MGVVIMCDDIFELEFYLATNQAHFMVFEMVVWSTIW